MGGQKTDLKKAADESKLSEPPANLVAIGSNITKAASFGGCVS